MVRTINKKSRFTAPRKKRATETKPRKSRKTETKPRKKRETKFTPIGKSIKEWANGRKTCSPIVLSKKLMPLSLSKLNGYAKAAERSTRTAQRDRGPKLHRFKTPKDEEEKIKTMWTDMVTELSGSYVFHKCCTQKQLIANMKSTHNIIVRQSTARRLIKELRSRKVNPIKKKDGPPHFKNNQPEMARKNMRKV